MRDDVHPLSTELLAISQDPTSVGASTLDHIQRCVACRVRLSRIQREQGVPAASHDSIQRIIDASTPLPAVLADLVSTEYDADPQPNEIWRVGTTEALLVWVRRTFDDGIADVVPVVLDSELADQYSLILDEASTPLSVEMAAIVPLRTHLPTRVFLNRIATVGIGNSIAEVMTAMREGRRPSGVHVGSPIYDDGDQRVEFRQALRDLLADLSPSAAPSTPESGKDEVVSRSAMERSAREEPPDDLHAVRAELEDRLTGVRIAPLSGISASIGSSISVRSVLKVQYLDTAVIVLVLSPPGLTCWPDYTDLAAAAQKIVLSEPDAAAVAIMRNTEALLFTSASMRTAVGIPNGNPVGPVPTLSGLTLVDTLCKHLDGSVTVWDVTDDSTDSGARTDFAAITSRHAAVAMAEVARQGGRALQPAKKLAWQSLDENFEQKAAEFVTSILGDGDIDAALTRLGLEGDND
ncbi:hypothetical protein [Nocardia sp. NPDC058633]|uniref:hypothetical protein n=1 Tax=Nocardia sp. NPDC058633 TaxID=3346568 RepID=UPI00365EAEDF